MFNTLLGPSWIARITLISLIACTYAGAVEINNKILFAWAADTPYRNWIFLPEGLELFFVMLFRWRGVSGITVGAAAIMLSEIERLTLADALFLGFASGFSAILTLWIFELLCRTRYPWTDLKPFQLFCISVLMGILSALFSQAFLMVLGVELLEGGLRDLLISAFGRIFGIFIFLYLALTIRSHLSRQAAQE